MWQLIKSDFADNFGSGTSNKMRTVNALLTIGQLCVAFMVGWVVGLSLWSVAALLIGYVLVRLIDCGRFIVNVSRIHNGVVMPLDTGPKINSVDSNHAAIA